MEIQEKMEESKEEGSDFDLSAIAEVRAVSSHESREVQIMATIKAPLYEPQTRAPLDIICVVDRSGSMAGPKLELVKKTIGFVVDQMKEKDKLGIVSYDNTVRLDLKLSNMNTSGKEVAKRTTNSIVQGGSTNLCGGLVASVDEMRKEKTNQVATCLLFTDGLANCGPTSAPGIMDAVLHPSSRYYEDNTEETQQLSGVTSNTYPSIPNRRSSWYQKLVPTSLSNWWSGTSATGVKSEDASLPCTINTFGFGGDHDPNLLTTIAERADGIYYYIQTVEEIPKAFANCLGGLVSVVGQNISLKFETEGNITITKVLTKFRQETSSDKKITTISIGDIQSEEQRNILCNLSVPAVKGEVASPQVIAKITVSYFNVITSRLESQTTTVAINRPKKVEPADKERNQKLDVENNRILGAQAMDEAVQKGNEGDLDQARTILDNAMRIISNSVSAKDPFCVNLVADIQKCKDKLKTTEEFDQIGKQMMMTNSIAHFTERSSNMLYEGQERYSTQSRFKMASKFM